MKDVPDILKRIDQLSLPDLKSVFWWHVKSIAQFLFQIGHQDIIWHDLERREHRRYLIRFDSLFPKESIQTFKTLNSSDPLQIIYFSSSCRQLKMNHIPWNNMERIIWEHILYDDPTEFQSSMYINYNGIKSSYYLWILWMCLVRWKLFVFWADKTHFTTYC